MPAIAKTKKNDNKTRIVSCSNGSELKTAKTRTYKTLIDVMARKGLKTLNALKEFKLKPPALAFSTVLIGNTPPLLAVAITV